MSELASPEWTGPLATGLFGTAYSLGEDRALVLVGSPGMVVGSHPDRTWAWIIMKGRTRDFAFEESLGSNDDLAALTGAQVIGGDRLFTAREKDLESVFRILRDAARREGPRHPDRRTAV
jgi:hypothetical protein